MTRELLLENICPTDYTDVCVLVGCEHCEVKLNELLDEYDKHVIEQYKADTNLKDTIREIHDNVAREMYCKGIDDFAKKLKAECREHYIDCDPYFGGIVENILYEDDIDELAEQLKAGGKE